MMILVALFAAVVCVLIVVAVISFKIAVFLVGVLLVVLAVALVVAPLIALVAAAQHFDVANPGQGVRYRWCSRVAVISTAAVGFVAFDIVWITHSLHWAQAPLLAYLLLSAAAAGALALLQEPVMPWQETPVPTGDRS